MTGQRARGCAWMLSSIMLISVFSMTIMLMPQCARCSASFASVTYAQHASSRFRYVLNERELSQRRIASTPSHPPHRIHPNTSTQSQPMASTPSHHLSVLVRRVAVHVGSLRGDCPPVVVVGQTDTQPAPDGTCAKRRTGSAYAASHALRADAPHWFGLTPTHSFTTSGKPLGGCEERVLS